jgi:coatomer protein complex subunit alpha (xenin)
VISDPLAYLTAKTNNLPEIAEEILETAGLTEADIDDVPSFGKSTLKPPPIVTQTSDLVWPTISKGENFFDKALANGHLEADSDAYVNGYDGAAASTALDDWAKDEEVPDDIDPEEEGWELDADGADAHSEPEVAEEDADAAELGAGAGTGVDETELWVRNSPFPADHVAAGSFESAMQVMRIYLVT